MLDGVRRSFGRGVELLSTRSRQVGLCQGDVRIRPSFSSQQGEFHSDAEDCFGLYAAAFAIRWCRNCANFLAAARVATGFRLYSPAVLLSYASAFHTLHAYLALHGCVVVDPANVEGELPSPENAKSAAIAGRLTKAGGWKFEGIHRTHRSRWKELHRV